MAGERVRFEGAAGDEIVGLLDLPDGDVRAYGIFAHCFTCSKNVRVVPEVAKRLNAAGLAMLRFDFTGLGQSEGDFAETTFRTNTGDLHRAAEWLAAHHEAPRYLVGHSLGGAAVLSVAGDIEGVRCVATIAAPAEATHVRDVLSGARFDERGIAEVRIGGQRFPLSRAFVEDLETHDVLARTRTLDLPLLLFHAPDDRVVGIDHAERLFDAAKHPKSFVSLDDADHLVSDPGDAAFVGDVLAAWAGHYVQAQTT